MLFALVLIISILLGACKPPGTQHRYEIQRTTPRSSETHEIPVTPMPPGKGISPVHINIPAVGVDVDVRPVGWHIITREGKRTTEWDVLPEAAGHHYGSANPGEEDNVVISGHNVQGRRVFEGLSTLGYKEKLPSNIRVFIRDKSGRVFVYLLEHQVLLPSQPLSEKQRKQQLSFMQHTHDARLTLITCWPLGDTTYRLVVWGPLSGMVPTGQP